MNNVDPYRMIIMLAKVWRYRRPSFSSSSLSSTSRLADALRRNVIKIETVSPRPSNCGTFDNRSVLRTTTTSNVAAAATTTTTSMTSMTVRNPFQTISDRSFNRHTRSTEHAPSFVGNSSSAATALAKAGAALVTASVVIATAVAECSSAVFHSIDSVKSIMSESSHTDCEDRNSKRDGVMNSNCALTATTTTAAAATTTATTATTTTTTTEPTPQLSPDLLPLWPGGVRQQDIEDLVDEILKDPNVNIKFLPDAFERRLYKSTIQLTLNSVYALLSSIDGLPFLSHQIKVKRVSRHGCDHHGVIQRQLIEKAKDVDVKALEAVADKMLQNPAVNMSLVPDSIERQVYSRCLIVIFRVLTILFSSLRVTIANHDFGLHLQPAVFERVAMNAVSATAATGNRSSGHGRNILTSSSKDIDLQKLQQHAESCGVSTEYNSNDLTDVWSMWDRIWNKKQFMINLHTTLYGLLLGIFDDLFANTQIHILSDEISLDIVPKSTFSHHGDNDTQHQKGGEGNRPKTGSKGEDNSKINHEKSDGTKERTNESKRMDRMTMSVAYVSTVTFMAGLGLGFALSSSINNRR